METTPIADDISSQYVVSGHVPEANGHRTIELEVNSLLERRIKDWGESDEVARENLEWFQECAMTLVNSPNNSNDGLITSLFDLFAALLNPTVNAPTRFLILFWLWRCEMPLADTLVNFETPADWWRDIGVSKWMCFKMANEFCDSLNLPRRSTQRDKKSRMKMRTKRLEPKKKK